MKKELLKNACGTFTACISAAGDDETKVEASLQTGNFSGVA
jgi:hypothetical protein